MSAEQMKFWWEKNMSHEFFIAYKKRVYKF